MAWKHTNTVRIAQGTPTGVSKRDLDIPTSPHLDAVMGKLHAKGHKALIVGGAVRDALLGEKPKDVDVEVYGTNYDDLADTLKPHGKVNQVGKAFGVVKFTDHDRNEYDFSLPRRDNKTGIGHKDFKTEFDPDITPKEAASRRDFTFNSLAYDPINKELHDYHGGEQDLKDKVIRHTSDQFAEDPLRVLRGMQFSARYGMTVHPDTAKLANSIKDEYKTIPKERVSEEFMKLATKGKEPGRAVDYLKDTGWHENFPALHACYGTPQDKEWHPEGDLEEHVKHSANAGAKIADREGLKGDDRAVTVLGSMCHDFGKPSTTDAEGEHVTSHGHDTAGEPIVRQFLGDIGIKPSIASRVAPLVREHMQHLNYDKNLSSRTVRRLAERLHPATIKELSHVMEADSSGRPPIEGGMPSGAQKMLDKASESNVTNKKQDRLVNGRDVMPYFNNEPGPHIGEHVNAAYEAQLNGEINTREQGKQWLHDRLTKKGATHGLEGLTPVSDADKLPKSCPGCDADPSVPLIQRGEDRYDPDSWRCIKCMTKQSSHLGCPECGGTGQSAKPYRGYDECGACKGTGIIQSPPTDGWACEVCNEPMPGHVVIDRGDHDHRWRPVKQGAVDVKHLIVEHGADPQSIDHTNSSPEDVDWVHGELHKDSRMEPGMSPADQAMYKRIRHKVWKGQDPQKLDLEDQQECFNASLHVERATGAVQENGEYWGPEIDHGSDSLSPSADPDHGRHYTPEGGLSHNEGYGHWWNRKRDGTIIDASSDQFKRGEGVRVIPPDDPRQKHYWAQIDSDDERYTGDSMEGCDDNDCDHDTPHYAPVPWGKGHPMHDWMFEESHPRTASWEGFPFDQRKQEGPRVRDTEPARTDDGHFVLYHGTSKASADAILRDKQFKPDDLGTVGFGTTPSDVRIYGLMKDKAENVVLRATIDKDWLGSQRATHEYGGSGYNQFLIQGPHGGKQWGGVPPEAVRDVQVHQDTVEREAMKRIGSWKDVRNKAVRLRNANFVDIIELGEDFVTAKVQGDHDRYDVVLWRQFPGSESITTWDCDCEWGKWAFKRQHTYVGRLCSHALATLYETHAQDRKKKSKIADVVERKDVEAIPCRQCSGTGEWKGLCSRCYGEGWDPVFDGDCTQCNGHGRGNASKACKDCKGSGLVLNVDSVWEWAKGSKRYSNPGRGTLNFIGGNRPISIKVEVARDATSITQGLMNRPYLEQYSGMVFLYPYPPSYSAFWMMNTLIPLSIAFWDREGRIIEVKDMEPCPPGRSNCPVYKCSRPYWGAVEVNKGFFRQWGIGPGTKVVLDL